MTIKIAIAFGPTRGGWDAAVDWVLEAERLGVDSVWCSETWGFDAATPLAYLAAKTARVRLGTSIMQAGTRTPAVVAMTAATLSSLSNGRFLLGLGPAARRSSKAGTESRSTARCSAYARS